MLIFRDKLIKNQSRIESKLISAGLVSKSLQASAVPLDFRLLSSYVIGFSWRKQIIREVNKATKIIKIAVNLEVSLYVLEIQEVVHQSASSRHMLKYLYCVFWRI